MKCMSFVCNEYCKRSVTCNVMYDPEDHILEGEKLLCKCIHVLTWYISYYDMNAWLSCIVCEVHDNAKMMLELC